MKKNYFTIFGIFMLSLCATLFVSCSSDDDDNDNRGGGTVEVVGKTYYNQETGAESQYNKEITFKSPSLASIRCWGYDLLIYDNGEVEKNRFDWTKSCSYRIDGNNIVLINCPTYAYEKDYVLEYKGDILVGEDGQMYKLTEDNSGSMPSGNFTNADIKGLWVPEGAATSIFLESLNSMGYCIAAGDDYNARKEVEGKCLYGFCFHTLSTGGKMEISMSSTKNSSATTIRTIRFPKGYMYLQERHESAFEYSVDGSYVVMGDNMLEIVPDQSGKVSKLKDSNNNYYVNFTTNIEWVEDVWRDNGVSFY